jgi:hypothetical protein
MKYSKTVCTLALSIILVLLITVTAIPAQAAHGALVLSIDEGKIGDEIVIDGSDFDAHGLLFIYFSSDKAEEDDYIGEEVTAYEQINAIPIIDENGDFSEPISFNVPDALTDGKKKEDVHDGNYYIYVTYVHGDQRIIKWVPFLVTDGEIELDPEKGTVGTQVQISGEGLRPDQEIVVKYDDYDIDIASGDGKTDGDGSFTCTITIPESTVGNHVITVIDESGDTPEAVFSVEPEITIEPTQQIASNAVNTSGTGFKDMVAITITLDGKKLTTTPELIRTNYNGSFSGSFLVPSRDIYGTAKIEATDSYNTAEAPLIIIASISLSPTTSLTSPGHVGMKLIIQGAGFTPDSSVPLTYSNNDETIPVVTTTVDAQGNFWENFIVPPGVAGSYLITATGDTSTVTATFIMESQAPRMPVPLVPEVARTVAARTHFDWEDVTDLSGVSYSLQVASDADFTKILLEREGLSLSEYTLATNEKLESTEEEVPYYWRVKAVDGAFNESEWTYPRSFYVGFSWTSIPDWGRYILYGFGAVLIVILGLWVRGRSGR